MRFCTIPTIKIRSRNAPKWRKRLARLYWLTLLVAFGMGCHAAFLADNSSNDSNTPIVAEAPATLENVVLTQETPAPVETPAELATVEPVAEPVVEPIISYPRTEELAVESGDNFVSLLAKVNIGASEAHKILAALGKQFNARNLKAGDTISITLDKKPEASAPSVTALSMAVSALSTLNLTYKEGGRYDVQTVNTPVVKRLARAGGMIDSSLYETIVESGMPVGMVSEIITAYSYDVDFQRDIQPGNRIDVVFEQMRTEDSGKVVGYGNILYAELAIRGRDLRIYRYADKNGQADYYTAKGESVRKALLRTPINGARISSGFGMRNHPILGYSKMHKGVDFAAPIGTPIYAAGDGVVSFAGTKGGYGNYLQINHNTKYASAYAHLSRFAKGVAPGKKVKQGQIVAYVGSSGMSTGPHLHYEILMAGAQVNPANVKFKTGNVLSGKELAAFKQRVETVHAQLDALPKPDGKLAMLDGNNLFR